MSLLVQLANHRTKARETQEVNAPHGTQLYPRLTRRPHLEIISASLVLCLEVRGTARVAREVRVADVQVRVERGKPASLVAGEAGTRDTQAVASKPSWLVANHGSVAVLSMSET